MYVFGGSVEELIAVKKVQKSTCHYINISKESSDKLGLKAGVKVIEKIDKDTKPRRLIFEIANQTVVQ